MNWLMFTNIIMKDFLQLKNQLLKACFLFVLKKEAVVTKTIAEAKKALFTETKSSAGDKHETGRALLQLEMEKASQQLAPLAEMKAVLEKINPKKLGNKVVLGSVIITDKHNYYLAISAGKETIQY